MENRSKPKVKFTEQGPHFMGDVSLSVRNEELVPQYRLCSGALI